MSFAFKVKDQVIDYLSVESTDINTMSKLTDFRKQGERLVNAIKGEVNNNASTNLDKKAFLNYLSQLKEELWGYFSDESFINSSRASAEYNLKVFNSNTSKYLYKWTMEEYQLVFRSFKSSLENEAAVSFNEMFDTRIKDKFRRLADLPFTMYPKEQIPKLIAIVLKEGYGDHFHWAVHYKDDPDLVKHPAVRWYYQRFLILNTEEYKTTFLWSVVGFLLSKIEKLEKELRRMDFYFRDPGDVSTVMSALRESTLEQGDIWHGVKITKARKGTDQIEKSGKGILALIEVLKIKGYLIPFKEITPVARAFCNTFQITLSDRSLTETGKNHDLMYSYFETIIPNR